MSARDDTATLVLDDRDSPPRAEVERWLREQVRGRSAEDALLVGTVVGELLDNARRYGSPPYVLQLAPLRRPDPLVVRVRNGAERHVGPWRSGAGLLVVDALAAQWGVVSFVESTTVWAKLLFED
ncbi:hypothetical protein Q5530_13485 [Saccharothrix sp. BKS2]|uniref:hypothetical protein n=1 Tax=Saccharothrix sp. BKS2 TaxID=3064400 RepID=UPI0039E8B94E